MMPSVLPDVSRPLLRAARGHLPAMTADDLDGFGLAARHVDIVKPDSQSPDDFAARHSGQKFPAHLREVADNQYITRRCLL